MSLPPLLVVAPGHSDARVRTWTDTRCAPDRAEAFGATLIASRDSRGLLTEALTIFASETPSAPLGAPPDKAIWIPHLYRWAANGRPAIAWELVVEDRIQAIFGTALDAIRRWQTAPERLLELAALARDDVDAERDVHLSLRWVLAHEADVVAALSNARVTLDHVSVQVTQDEEPRVVAALTSMGLVEVVRPSQIKSPGRWLQAGNARVHLNSREARSGETTFPASAPNHVCFAVADLDDATAAVQAAGFRTVMAGSLGSQVWWRLASGTTIELQLRAERG